MIIYLSGPMSGYPDFNYPAFNAAAAQLRVLGHEVINPTEISSPEDGYKGCMRKDLRELLRDGVDTIAVLPGWQDSKGARDEVYVAQIVGIDLVDAATLRPLHVQCSLHIFGTPERDCATCGKTIISHFIQCTGCMLKKIDI